MVPWETLVAVIIATVSLIAVITITVLYFCSVRCPKHKTPATKNTDIDKLPLPNNLTDVFQVRKEEERNVGGAATVVGGDTRVFGEDARIVGEDARTVGIAENKNETEDENENLEIQNRTNDCGVLKAQTGNFDERCKFILSSFCFHLSFFY